MDFNDEIHRHLNDSSTYLVLVLLFIDSLEGFEFMIKGCLISDCDIFDLVKIVFSVYKKVLYQLLVSERSEWYLNDQGGHSDSE